MQSPPAPSSADAIALPRRMAIGDRVVDMATYEVFVGDVFKQRLTPKAYGVLCALLEHEGKPVHRDLLISKVWPKQFPTDDVVTKAIRELRRALGETDEQSVIATLPRIGYLLKVAVTRLDDPAPVERAGSEADTPDTPRELAPMPAESPPHAQQAGQRALQAMLWWPLLGLAVALGLWIWLRPAPPTMVEPAAASLAPNRAFAPQLEVLPFTADPGDEGAPDVSDDGLFVAYSSRRRGAAYYRIYVRSVDGLSERRLTNVDEAVDELQPVFAPDGRRLAYQVFEANERCSLRLMDLNGSQPRTLGECTSGVLVQMEFARDGSHLLVPPVRGAGPGNGGLLRLDLSSGELAPLDYPHDPDQPDVEGRYSPDGRWLLLRRGAAPLSQLLLLAVDRKEPPRHMPGIRGLIRGIAWLPDSRNVVFATDATGILELWRLDVESGFVERFGGVQGDHPAVAAHEPVLVTRQVLQASSLLPIALDGKVDADPQPVFASNRSESWPAYAPDGKRLVFVSDRSGSNQIYLGDLDEGGVQQLSQFEAGNPHTLSFSPDGRQVAFTLRLLDRSQVGVLDLEGRWTRLLELGLRDPEHLSFGPDGRLWLTAARAEGGSGIYMLDSTDAKPQPVDSACARHFPQLGSDGRLYALGAGYNALQQIDPSGATTGCTAFSAQIHWETMHNWTVSSAQVYAVLPDAPGQSVFELLAARTPRRIERLAGEDSLVAGLAIRPDQLEAVLSLARNAQADLMMVRGF